MGARFRQMHLDLSRMLVDQVDDPAVNGQEFSAGLRSECINNSEKNIIAKICSDMKPKELMVQLAELVRTYSTSIGGPPFVSPPGSIRVVKVFSGGSSFGYVEPDRWDGVRRGFNPEETADFYGTEPCFRWTELADDNGIKQVEMVPLAFTGIITMRYIKDHVDLTVVSAEDLLLPARFDPQILQGAYSFATGLLQNK